MVRWHHQLNGHEFEQTLGDGEGQGSLVCCSPCGHKKQDMTQLLNNSKSTRLRHSSCLQGACSFVKLTQFQQRESWRDEGGGEREISKICTRYLYLHYLSSSPDLPKNKQTKRLKILTLVDFPGDAAVKNQPADSEDTGLIPGPGKFHTPGATKPMRCIY